MASDGGGRFIPVGIVGVHTSSLLLASLVAHDRATEDNHTHHTGRERLTNTLQDKSWVQYIGLDREVLTPSPFEYRIDTDVNSHADETVMESYLNIDYWTNRTLLELVQNKGTFLSW